MRRKLPLILGLILVALLAVAIRYSWERRAQQKREAAYEAALQSYSQVFRPGITRKEVEGQLRTKGSAFQQMCCIDERSAYADLLRIGKEKAPWFCSEQNIYIAFQFVAVEPHESWRAYDSDALKKITVFRWLEGCL
jgi:hypothetical protein